MKYETPKCPECGEPAAGEVDIIPAIANVAVDYDGNAEYTGDTKVDFNSQKNALHLIGGAVYDAVYGYKIVTCGDHDWITKV